MCTIDLTGRAGAVLAKGGRTMDLDGELMASGDEWVLYRASVGLWSDGTVATASEIQDIVDQVVRVLATQGVRVIVE